MGLWCALGAAKRVCGHKNIDSSSYGQFAGGEWGEYRWDMCGRSCAQGYVVRKHVIDLYSMLST